MGLNRFLILLSGWGQVIVIKVVGTSAAHPLPVPLSMTYIIIKITFLFLTHHNLIFQLLRSSYDPLAYGDMSLASASREHSFTVGTFHSAVRGTSSYQIVLSGGMFELSFLFSLVLSHRGLIFSMGIFSLRVHGFRFRGLRSV